MYTKYRRIIKMDKPESYVKEMAKIFSFEDMKNTYNKMVGKAEPPKAIVYSFIDALLDKRATGKLNPNKSYRKAG